MVIRSSSGHPSHSLIAMLDAHVHTLSHPNTSKKLMVILLQKNIFT